MEAYIKGQYWVGNDTASLAYSITRRCDFTYSLALPRSLIYV